jgi:hypothetical protein
MNKLVLPTLVFFIFLLPFKSHSTTFKCEFVTEKFSGGKNSKSSCTATPEIIYGTINYTPPREVLCKYKSMMGDYWDYKDYIVDLNKKIISYKDEVGFTQDGIKRMTKSAMKNRKGESKQEIQRRYSTPHIYHTVTDILSSHSFIQKVNLSDSNNWKGENSTSYLISYKLKDRDESERFLTLYIPKNGSSIISEYLQTPNPDRGEGSWLSMKFGKCVQTSD